MLVADFHYELPEELIAQTPSESRDGGRLLALDRRSGAVVDGQFRNFPALLQAGDVLVLNDSRVIPARLYGVRAGAAGRIEVLLTKRLGQWEWAALVKPARKVRVGERLVFTAGAETGSGVRLVADVVATGEFGERTLRFEPVPDFDAVLDELGHVPLPPYMHREDELADRERYQTVFARERGSAAAPTAGLHFTGEILDRIANLGVELVRVTLHVGLGTFQPLRAKRVEDVHLHSESYTLPEATAASLNRARSERRRVVAVGTTVVRTLEHCARLVRGGPLQAHSGETSLFLYPGEKFNVVGAMLTNFHLPQSSLLMLVCAFGGTEPVLAAYRHAVSERYRFFSYGDAMFIA